MSRETMRRARSLTCLRMTNSLECQRACDLVFVFTPKRLWTFPRRAIDTMPAPIDLSSKYGVRGAASAAQPQVGVPVRPVVERVRDYAILYGAVGGLVGACVSARHEVPMLRYTLAVGGVSGTLAGMFIGLRHALLQDRWEQDSEVVSGFTAGALGMVTMTLLSGPQAGARAGVTCFIGGGLLHYAHRWWLHARLANEWH